ncbi:hypothetical protein V6N12_063441 [Hibiscus sabdariffa]|uniref:Uncharacterized protein n=1 Tax=Hibiscus sabdariffa TaxID=183260 RepID=A0ABR2FC30_9ROSI
MVDKNVDKQKGIVIRVENLLRTNCNREMRQTWNKEATIHICDENTIHSYFSGKKAPYTGVNLAYVSPRNTGILGHHKKDIESRLSNAFPNLYLGLFEALLEYAKDPKYVGDAIFHKSFSDDL